MTITIEPPPRLYHFSDIKPGECFQTGSLIFIRLARPPSGGDDPQRLNCAILSDGEMDRYSDATVVTPVDATCVVREKL